MPPISSLDSGDFSGHGRGAWEVSRAGGEVAAGVRVIVSRARFGGPSLREPCTTDPVSRRVGGLFVGLLLWVAPALAQDTERIELTAIVGTAGFIDEAIDYHSAVGGAVRMRLSRRLSLQPEVLYLRRSSRDQDYSLQLALIGDVGGRPDVRPYWVVGGGLLHSRFRFPGALRERFSSTEFTGGGGGGVRSTRRRRRDGWKMPLKRIS